MSVLDVFLLGAAFLAVIGGYRLGFIARVASWVGLASGLALGVWLLPRFLNQLQSANPNLVVILSIALLLVGAILGQALGFFVSARLAPVRKIGAFTIADKILGGLAGLVGAVVVLWLVIPVFVATPGWLSAQTSNSWIAQSVERSLPRAPDPIQAVRAVIGNGSFPDVFDSLRPTPDLGTPPDESGLSIEVAGLVARSVVKVEGAACARIQDGSGFVVAEDLIATNAHVVAGERSTTIIRDDGRSFIGSVVVFDPNRDIALVRVRNFGRPPLTFSSVASRDTEGIVGGVFGHPGGDPLRIAPFKIARLITATGRDIYGTNTTERKVLELSASLRPGDSGSALTNQRGEVVGIAFAVARDNDNVAYALALSELQTALASPGSEPVSTGKCLN
ncbi:MAG: MarP family serine protease [Acidimicrobiales bacterium]